MKRAHFLSFSALLAAILMVATPAQAQTSSSVTTVDINTCAQLNSITGVAGTAYVITSPLTCSGNITINAYPSTFNIGAGGSLSTTGTLVIDTGSTNIPGGNTGSNGVVTVTITGTPVVTVTETTLVLSCQDLQNINNNLSGNYQLANDIDCSATKNWNGGQGFIPVGFAGNVNLVHGFSGSLDGQGHKISDLFENPNIGIGTSNVSIGTTGLFTVISGGSIQNLVISNPSITSAVGAQSGALAGFAYGNSTINNVHVVGGTVKGDQSTGGLIGMVSGVSINNSSANTNVIGNFYVGGLVGYFASPGGVQNSFATGTVEGNQYLGGLIGMFSGSCSSVNPILNSYSQANVSQLQSTANSAIGGLIGYLNCGQTINTYATGHLTSAGASNMGGLVGQEPVGATTASYWDTQATGQAHSAGSPDANGYSTAQFIQKAPSFINWDYVSTWIADFIHYPILRWQEQKRIDLWTVFSALGNEDTFKYFVSPLNTVNWTVIDGAENAGVNWTDFLALSQPRVWNFPQITVNNVNWEYLTGLSYSPINWLDMAVIGRSGINWLSIDPVAKSGVNWSDWVVLTRTGINWNDFVISSRTGINWHALSIVDKAGLNWNEWNVISRGTINWFNVSIISNVGINWNNVGVLSTPININNLAVMTKKNINWSVVNKLSKENVDWDSIKILKQVPLTATDVNTLRTLGAQSEGFSSNMPTALMVLNLTGDGSGNFTSTPQGFYCETGSGSGCAASFPLNQPITLTFSPINGSYISNWGGCTQTSATTCTVTPDQSLILNIALSAVPTYTITSSVNNSKGGAVNPSGITTVGEDLGTMIFLQSNPGYLIAGYSIDGKFTPVLPSTTVTSYGFNDITANHTFEAFFSPTDNLSLNINGNGQGTILTTSSTALACNFDSSGTGETNCTGPFIVGTSVTLIATPNSGYVFTGWKGIAGCSSQATCTFTIKSKVNATATFTTSPFTITPYIVGKGKISPKGPVSVIDGANASFTITPAAGYYIATEAVDGALLTTVQKTIKFTDVTSDHTFSVDFEPNPVIMPSIVGKGTISPKGPVSVTYGGNVSFTITPAAGYHIATEAADGVPLTTVQKTVKFTDVTSNQTFSVDFESNPIITPSIAGSGKGTVSPDKATTVAYDGSQSFTISPAAGSYIAGEVVDGVSLTTVQKTIKFTDVTSGHTFSVDFEKK